MIAQVVSILMEQQSVVLLFFGEIHIKPTFCRSFAVCYTGCFLENVSLAVFLQKCGVWDKQRYFPIYTDSRYSLAGKVEVF